MTIWRIWYSLMDRRDRLPINLALIDLILRAPKIHLLREEHSHLSRKRSFKNLSINSDTSLNRAA
jgi:hypothetical protein